MTHQDRIAEDGRPFDLEQECRLVADVPGAVDAFELGLRTPGDRGGGYVALFEVEPIRQPAAVDAADLLAAPDPDPRPDPVAQVR